TKRCEQDPFAQSFCTSTTKHKNKHTERCVPDTRAKTQNTRIATTNNTNYTERCVIDTRVETKNKRITTTKNNNNDTERCVTDTRAPTKNKRIATNNTNECTENFPSATCITTKIPPTKPPAEPVPPAGPSADKVFTIKKLQFFIPPISADRVISLLYFSCVFGTLNIVRAVPGNKR
ncbi:Hypothetical protein, putative, partial [Bodo saltans]